MKINHFKLKSILSAIWKDPVWSKVIASFLVTFLGVALFFITGMDYLLSKSRPLRNKVASPTSVNLNKQILNNLILTATTKEEVKKRIGNPIDTRSENNFDIWLYLEKAKEEEAPLSMKSITLKFRSDNTVAEKAYAEFSGNKIIKYRELYSKIKRGVTTQEEVRSLFGNPTTVRNKNGVVQWHYEYKETIFGTNFNGQINHTLDISFDSNQIVKNVFGGGGVGNGPKSESPYGAYYTL